jgi:hypothetical protein
MSPSTTLDPMVTTKLDTLERQLSLTRKSFADDATNFSASQKQFILTMLDRIGQKVEEIRAVLAHDSMDSRERRLSLEHLFSDGRTHLAGIILQLRRQPGCRAVVVFEPLPHECTTTVCRCRQSDSESTVQ